MYSFYDYMPHMAEGGQPQEQHEDTYAGMAMGQLAALQEKAAMLRKFLNPETEIDPWVASKITLADDYITSVTDYLKHGEKSEQMPNPGGQEPNGYQEYPQGAPQQGPQEEMMEGPQGQNPQEEMMEPPMARWGGRYQTGGIAQGGQGNEVQQVIEVYSQMSGIKSDEIMQKLQAMKPAQQKKAYSEMKKAVVTAMQKQQAQPQAQGQDMMAMGQESMQAPQQGMMMKHGGYFSHDGSYRQAMGSGTNSGNAYYAYGGDIMPNYMKESSPMYNFGGYFPQGPRFRDGGNTLPKFQDAAVVKACNSKKDCHGDSKEAVNFLTGAERRQERAMDKEAEKASREEAEAIAKQKQVEWSNYTNTGLDPYDSKYARRDHTFSDSYNNFITANPGFVKEQSMLNLSPEQRYAMIYKMAGRSGSADFAAPKKLRAYMKLPEGSRFTDQQLYEATQRMGGIDKYADWWRGGWNDIKKYGGMYEDGGQTQDGSQMGMIDVYKKGGIYIKPSHRGRFTEYKKRTGKTTEEALHSPDPHVRQMANFARNAAKWKHEDGGLVNGQVISNVTPDMLQELKRGGYSYEIIND